MSRTIRAIIEIDEDGLKEYVEENGGEYIEDCLSEDLNGALDSLPFSAWVEGYTIEGDEEEEEDEQKI